MGYEVKTEAFEGPLEVLLNMIERRKLYINDLSLSQIADDYIFYIKNSHGFSIRESTDFILIASALMLIKSRSLLPNLDLTLDEEKKISDLEDRLKQYQRIRDLSQNVKKLFGEKPMFQRLETKVQREVKFSPDESVNTENIFALAVEVLTRVPKKQIVPKNRIRKVISLEEMIDTLTERIRIHMNMSFNQFTKGEKKDKVYIVVSFLALLELFKQGTISINQESSFGDIQIESRDIGIPSY